MAIEALQHYEDHPMAIRHAIGEMLEMVRDFQVTDDLGFRSITALYSKAREWQKIIETKRKEAIEPSRKIVNLINDKAKELSDPLSQVIALSNQKAAGWVAQVEARQRQEAERLKEAAALLDLDEGLDIPETGLSLRGDGAATVTKIVKRFKVTDKTKVPLKYLMIDESLVDRDIKLGIGQIEGIEIYEETITTLRKR